MPGPKHRTPRTPAPDVLHLGRLATASPDAALELPGSRGALRVLHLLAKRPDDAGARWYVCLAGELLIDLPHGNFVHLRAHETVLVAGGTARTLTPVRAATVLLVDVEEEGAGGGREG